MHASFRPLQVQITTGSGEVLQRFAAVTRRFTATKGERDAKGGQELDGAPRELGGARPGERLLVTQRGRPGERRSESEPRQE